MDKAALSALQKEIAELEKLLASKKHQLEEAQTFIATQTADPTENFGINNNSPPELKITLFRSLFRGREDVYAERFESKKTGEPGYQPVCRNEWVQGICGKCADYKTKCNNCTQRSLDPITDKVIESHLIGFTKNKRGNPEPFVMGVYPLLLNETCYFLAIDFDRETWREDAKAFMDTCKLEDIPSALERSRSGNGAHIWIFFDTPVPISGPSSLQ